MRTLGVYARYAPAVLALGLSACGGDDDGTAPPPVATDVTTAAACSTLAGKAVGGATVTSAAMVAASTTLPTYCKVTATIAPSLDMVLSLPNNWNGKLLYEGGGGYDGSIAALDAGGIYSPGVFAKGYAVVQSNGGHNGNGLDASFANDPYLAYLFGSGSVPAAAQAASEMLQVGYNKAPTRSYYEGCSNGGREGLMAAERNPSLFDGIVARAPALNWVGLMGQFNRTAKALATPGGTFPAVKVALLAKAVRDACDANDGIVDGVVSNPATCNFAASTLRCTGGTDTGNTCLSDAQIAVVDSWTTPASFSGGTYTNAGWPLSGNEDDPVAWSTWLTGASGNGSTGLQFLFQDTTVKNYLAKSPSANSLTYVWDSNPGALFGLAGLNDATNANLTPFLNAGGKLILWHGTADSALSYRQTSTFYTAVTAAVGGKSVADRFVRYYDAPGVGHCAGGPGADAVDLVTPLDAWVTQGTDPGQPVANKLKTDGTSAFARPLCQYPQYPRYTGPANNAQAAALASSYTCTSP